MAKLGKRLLRDICFQLRKMREERNISLQQISRDLSIKEEVINDVELGFNGSIDICSKLMDYHHCKIKLVSSDE